MYSGVPRPRTDSRWPRISTSARPSVMCRLLPSCAHYAAAPDQSHRHGRGDHSESLDAGEVFQDALEPDAEPLRLGREVPDPRLETPPLGREPRVLRAERADQLDCALDMLLEQ